MSEMSLYEKLNVIQTELEAPKGKYNDFGRYKYRSAEDILNSLKPHLKELRLAILFEDEVLYIEGWFFIKSRAELIDLDSSDVVHTIGLARESESKKGMDSAQVTGSTSSYARKYALTAMFAIDDSTDSDTTNRGEETPEGGRAMKAKASPKEDAEKKHKDDIKSVMLFAIDLFGKDEGANYYKIMLQQLGVKSSSDMMPAQIKQAKQILADLKAESLKTEASSQEELLEL